MARSFNNTNQESGFALLMSLLVVGVIITVGLTLLDVTIKQLSLSTNAKDSEVAFHAANAGAECARYIRRTEAATMIGGGNISPSCFGASPASDAHTEITGGNVSGDGNVYRYQYSFTWGEDSDRCTLADTIILNSDVTGSGLTLSSVANYVAGYPQTDKDCPAGAICTILAVKGYNKPCNQTGSYGTLEREVLIEF